MKPPKVETAKVPGMCCACGQRIYVGDKIRCSFVAGNPVAFHKECWHQ